jgi:hypothetical protein
MSPLNIIVQLLLAEPPGQQPYIKMASESTGENEKSCVIA